MNALMNNMKTYKSLDFTTICPKLATGKPCSYCYVESSRKIGCNAKIKIDRCSYNGEILRLRNETIEKLNKCGGLRLFSFADYYEWMDNDLKIIIKDAKKVGLKLKAITKQVKFIEKFSKDFDIINVSIDALGEGVDINIAKELKHRYPNVRIRAAIMNPEELKELDWVDVITLNHAHNGYHYFTRKQISNLSKTYKDKLCCVTGKCESCSIQCGR